MFLSITSAIGILTTVLYRSRTGFHKTDTVIKRLMRGSIQTGVFSSIFSLCDLITFLAATDSNLYGMFAFPVGRIYTNVSISVLYTLLTAIDWLWMIDLDGYIAIAVETPRRHGSWLCHTVASKCSWSMVNCSDGSQCWQNPRAMQSGLLALTWVVRRLKPIYVCIISRFELWQKYMVTVMTLKGLQTTTSNIRQADNV